MTPDPMTSPTDPLPFHISSQEDPTQTPETPSPEVPPGPSTRVLLPPAYVEVPSETDPLPSALWDLAAEEEHEEEDDEEDSEPLPAPDGGWGWIIVLVSFFCNLILDGLCYTFGVFFPVFVAEYGGSNSKTAWVGSLCCGCYLMTGPFAGAMVNAVGCRPVAIIGAVLACASFLAATFAPSLDLLILTWGVLGGVSLGLLYLPSVVILGLWFDKKRSLATGIGVAGSGVGTFVVPPLVRFVMKRHGWRMAVYILAGLIMVSGIACMVYKPTPSEKQDRKEKRRLRKAHKLTVQLTDSVNYKKPSRLSHDSGDTGDDQASPASSAKQSANDLSYGSAQSLNPTKAPRFAGSSNSLRKQVHLQALRRQEFEVAHSMCVLPQGPTICVSGSTEDMPHKKLSLQTSGSEKAVSADPQRHMQPPDYSIISHPSRQNSSPLRDSNPETPVRRRQRSRQTLHAPLAKRNLFYSGSTLNLAARTNGANEGQSQTSIPALVVRANSNERCEDEPSKRSRWSRVKSSRAVSGLQDLLDFSLFRSPTFLLLMVSSIISMLGFYVPFVYLADYAVTLSIPMDSATFLLSLLGITNTLGRVVAGLLADRPGVDALVVYNGSMIVGGALVASIPFLENYMMLAIFSLVFGFVIACVVSLKTIVVVEVLGVDRLTNAFGLLLLFMGAASIAGTPLAGLMYDETQSYHVAFMAAGACITLAGLISLPLRRLSAWEKSWGAPGATAGTTVTVTLGDNANVEA